jgi:transglutaminase-like putative cysteine protease
MKNFTGFCLIALWLSHAPPSAAQEVAEDLAYSISRYYIDYTIRPDGSFDAEYTITRKALQKKGVDALKQDSFSYSSSIETADILEAYTQKADGKIIRVPKNSYQLSIEDGNQGGEAAFSDTTTLTVVFPEVAIGDSVTLRFRLKAKEAIFPEQFSVSERFSKSTAFDDLRVRFNAPQDMKLAYEYWDLNKERDEYLDGRHLLAFSWQNPKPLLNHRNNYSVYRYGDEPGIIISTFQSYRDIAEAYVKRATPKAAVSERVAKLANEISQGKSAQHDIARSLYDWVATNISYAGNCVGLGQVVPRDLDFVLDNRMGDCKDHATLLQALLAAKGITSVQALINAGAVYELPKTPVVSTVNHVINFIPSLNLFADATSPSTPFGMLPFSDQDKPVLLADGYTETLKTPPQQPGSNEQILVASQKINADGSMQGHTEVSLHGIFAEQTRDMFRNYSKDREKDLIKNSFKSNGAKASGQFFKQDPSELLDTYQYSAQYDVQNYYQFNRVGVINLGPVFMNQGGIREFLDVLDDEQIKQPITCGSGKSSEEIVYQLPENFEILSIPDDFEIANSTLSYSANYKLDERILTVKRVLDDRTPTNVCNPETQKTNNELIKKARRNYIEQIVYKQVD